MPLLVPAALLLIAALYASVGHGGASGYVAVLALAGEPPGFIRPTALLLNVAVSGWATLQFARAGHFRWALFWPFTLTAVPCAWFAGSLPLSASLFGLLAGLVLLVSAIRLLWPLPEPEAPRPVHRGLALAAGALLGLLSGLVGVGGGIFLTPLLLFTGWARAQVAAAVSAPFILCNSLAGLGGWLSAGQSLPGLSALLPLLAATLLGGTVGAWLGARRLPHHAIKRALALVLMVAAAKLILH